MLKRTASMLLLATLTSSAATAQNILATAGAAPVGRIGEIRVTEPRAKCLGGPGPSRGAEVQRQRGTQTQTFREAQAADVRIGDRFTMRRFVDVRLFIDSPELGRGLIVFAPELLCSLSDADTSLKPYTKVERGDYRIAALDSMLLLGVSSGGAHIMWDSSTHKVLAIAVGGRVLHVTGTELSVATDSTGRTAMLYVREGTVRLPPGDNNIIVGAGQLVELPQGAPPRFITFDRARLIDLAQTEVTYHLGTVAHRLLPGMMPHSPRAWWRNPWVLTGAAATAATIGVCRARDDRCGLRPQRRGRVLVVIPL